MLTVAIQAGGQSRRMGRDKGLILLRGQPMIRHILCRVVDLGEEVLVTTNRPEDYAFLGVRVAADEKPDGGALSGLRTALLAAHGDKALVLGCDMPFVSRPLLSHLIELSSQADLVVPKAGGYYEPMHAAYDRRCLAEIEASLEAGGMKINTFFPPVNLLTVGESHLR